MEKFNSIQKKIIDFRDERDWKKFHNPKDIAMSINIEASELLECFQWKTDDEITEIINSDKKIAIEEEVADVANYLILLCNDLDINLFDAIENKLEKNKKKYPVEKCKGKANKYTDYSDLDN